MEDDILDDLQPVTSIKFAKRSFWCFIIPTLIIFLGVLVSVTTPIAVVVFSVLPLLLLPLMVFPAGIYAAIKSIRIKEPSTWFKYIGLIGNTIYLLLFIVVIISSILDMQDFAGN